MHSQNDEIVVEAFEPADQTAVKTLILAGLVEHWGVLDPTLNPDLDDIAVSYAGGTFLVARCAGRVVGSGALVPRGTRGEIVRMSVAADFRRRGLGRQILTQLVARARASGLRCLVLETTSTWSEVIAFYLQFGFHITHHHAGDTYFALDL